MKSSIFNYIYSRYLNEKQATYNFNLKINFQFQLKYRTERQTDREKKMPPTPSNGACPTKCQDQRYAQIPNDTWHLYSAIQPQRRCGSWGIVSCLRVSGIHINKGTFLVSIIICFCLLSLGIFSLMKDHLWDCPKSNLQDHSQQPERCHVLFIFL